MKPALLMLCYIILAAGVLAQTDNKPSPDGSRSLVLNQTTPEEAVERLGQPAADKVDRLDVSKLGKWLDPKHKQKIFRQLTFKKVGDFRAIGLSFLDDKLVMIELAYKKNVKPENLRNIFGVEFAIGGGPSDLPDKPGQYPRPFFATYYPDYFALIGISDQSFIWAICTASSGVPTGVYKTLQVSRTLEKK